MGKTTIKTKPNSLNEWTLELNIAHEIANMFDSPFGFLYPKRLRKMFDILPIDLTRLQPRKTKIYKLTPREEGNGGGWDTQVVIPSASGADDRVLYLQFKSGTHSDGNSIAGSKFNVGDKKPNRHIEFSFNDNDKKATAKRPAKPATQHQDLKNLSDHLISQGLSEKSVLYAFPRVSSMEAFDKLTDHLILYTTFVSHTEMDKNAAANKINLYDGQRHYFRSHYTNETNCEISSTPFNINPLETTQGLLEEIMSIHISRAWNQFYKEVNATRLKEYLTLSVADYLSVNPLAINELLRAQFTQYDGEFISKYFIEVEQRMRFYFEDFASNENYEELRNKRVRLASNLFKFIEGLEEQIDVNEKISSVYTTPLNRVTKNESAVNEIEVGDINLTSIVF